MTTSPSLGRLSAVAPREVWAHEAQGFTPWLLQNVDVLNDLLGMDLELEVAEHPVGGFSLDLLGRDLSDDSVVIVENQLEMSDHGHLGQILTYAAGTSPKTIVWINTGFRPEHRAALDWLNEHTDPDTRFFGIEIEVVRIGESVPAPNFKLVAQPNDWGKQVKAGTGVGAFTERGKLYWGFWEEYTGPADRSRPTIEEHQMPYSRLSEKFDALSDKAKESANKLKASAGREKDQLKADAAAARERATATADQFEEKVVDASATVSSQWDEVRGKWKAHLAKVRSNLEAKKDEHDAKAAARDADDAEDYALDAISFAQGAIEEAEAASLDAVYARANAVALSSGGARP